jgi:hypothetical protein
MKGGLRNSTSSCHSEIGCDIKKDKAFGIMHHKELIFERLLTPIFRQPLPGKNTRSWKDEIMAQESKCTSDNAMPMESALNIVHSSPSNCPSSALREWSITADIWSPCLRDLLLFLSLRDARFLVLLVLANEIVHIALCLSEFHLVHPFTSIPMQESLAPEHS